MKLKSKKFIQYKGEVIDLCVENSHTYNVEGIAVHNSAGGSLVAYVLYITDLDPIKWDLPFARFLSIYRKGAPDIDCVDSKHLVVMADRSYKCAGDILVGEQVLGGDNKPHVVSATYERSLRENEKAISLFVLANQETLGHMCVVPQHKFVKADGTICYAKDLKIDDELMASCLVRVISMKYLDENIVRKFVDITVEDDHRFHIIPFNVVELGNGLLGTPFDYQRGE